MTLRGLDALSLFLGHSPPFGLFASALFVQEALRFETLLLETARLLLPALLFLKLCDSDSSFLQGLFQPRGYFLLASEGRVERLLLLPKAPGNG